MATFTITIPNGFVDDVLDAFADVYNMPEGENKAQFAKAQVREFIKGVYGQWKSAEGDAAKRAIVDQAIVDAEVITVT